MDVHFVGDFFIYLYNVHVIFIICTVIANIDKYTLKYNTNDFFINTISIIFSR